MQANFITRLKRPISKKAIISIIILLAIAIGGVTLYKSKIIQNKFGKTTEVTQRTAAVTKGSVNVTVTGSGPLAYPKSTNAITKVAGTVTKLYFKEGDKVKAGDLIAEIDNKDAVQTVTDKQNSLNQTILSNSINATSEKDLLVKAPITGQVSDIKVIAGQSVSKGAQVLTITDSSKLKVMLRFNAGDIAKISVGQSADVYVPALMQSTKGTVTYINNQAETTSSGGQLVKVEITLDNPGALLGAMNANADIDTPSGVVTSIESGALEYVSKQVVLTGASGTVEQILVRDGQKVNGDTILVKLKNEDIAKNNELNQMKIDNSQSQLETAKKQLDDYKIYASIDGTITKQTLNVGDNVKANDTIATITDTNQIQFDIPIDELDIAKIAAGMKVKVTVDALTETSTEPLEAVVDKVPFSGTSTNGVATFNVTVKLTKVSEKLKSGMNASAVIEVSNVDNVVRVPIEAVTKTGNRTFVWVKSSSSSAANATQPQGNTPQGSNPQGTAGNATAQRPQGTDAQAAQGAQDGSTRPNRQNGQGTGTAGGGNNPQANGTTGTSNNAQSGSGNKQTNAAANTQSSNNSANTNNYYAGAVRKQIEVGVNNDSYIEVKSGLNEGDIIILPQLQTSSSSQSNSTQRTGTTGITGGFGGAVPGAMPATGGGRQ